MKHVAKISQTAASEVGALTDRFNETVDVPILQGRLIENVVIQKEVTTKIRHGLGRKLRGWIVVKNSSTQSLHDQQSDNKNEDQELWLFLDTGGTCDTFTVSLWVF
jgi:hypothetical protein